MSETTVTGSDDPLRPETVGPPEQAPDHPRQHGPSLKTYLIIFAVLMALLVLTVAVAFLPHWGYFNIAIALAIAVTKATLVVLFFMHVIESSRLTKVFVGATLLWVGILFAFTFADYVSRDWLPMSRGWNENPTIIQPAEPENEAG